MYLIVHIYIIIMREPLIAINGSIYDVGKFVDRHPGEGFFGIQMMDFFGKDCSFEFDKYHISNAKKNGVAENGKVTYVSPFYFNKKIPKNFFASDDQEREKMLKEMQYYMCPDSDNRTSKIIIVYKTNGTIYRTSLHLIGKRWEWKKMNAELFFVTVDDFLKRFENMGMTLF
jgi:hypothetical protein